MSIRSPWIRTPAGDASPLVEAHLQQPRQHHLGVVQVVELAVQGGGGQGDGVPVELLDNVLPLVAPVELAARDAKRQASRRLGIPASEMVRPAAASSSPGSPACRMAEQRAG